MLKIFLSCTVSLLLLACISTSYAKDLKIGEQIYSIYPIVIKDHRVVDHQIIPKSTIKLIESNLVESDLIIIRDRVVLAYFTGNRFIQGLLTDYIIFTCKNAPCNPTTKSRFKINAKTFSYGIKADSLTEWYELIDQLEKSPQVKAYFPTFINDARGKFKVSDVKIYGLMEKNFYFDETHK